MYCVRAPLCLCCLIPTFFLRSTPMSTMQHGLAHYSTPVHVEARPCSLAKFKIKKGELGEQARPCTLKAPPTASENSSSLLVSLSFIFIPGMFYLLFLGLVIGLCMLGTLGRRFHRLSFFFLIFLESVVTARPCSINSTAMHSCFWVYVHKHGHAYHVARPCICLIWGLGFGSTALLPDVARPCCFFAFSSFVVKHGRASISTTVHLSQNPILHIPMCFYVLFTI